MNIEDIIKMDLGLQVTLKLINLNPFELRGVAFTSSRRETHFNILSVDGKFELSTTENQDYKSSFDNLQDAISQAHFLWVY